jgi:anti-sigma regulatory factor (Ser/Thr protein kinase)
LTRDENRIFSALYPFVGREAERDRLVAAARSSKSLAVLGAPGAGTSELLRHAFDKFFFHSQDVIPVYFELRRSDGSAAAAARRFAREFLTLSIAFRRRDAGIIGTSPTLNEIARLALPEDGRWVDAAIEAVGRGDDDLSFSLSLPDRAAKRHVVFLDNIHLAAEWEDADRFFDLLKSGASKFVVAGLRRWLYGKFPWAQMRVDPLAFEDAGRLVQSLAGEHSVAISGPTRDLMAVQLESKATDIASLLRDAADQGRPLNDFKSVERVYTDSIFGGSIARRYGAILSEVTDAASDEAIIIRLLGGTREERISVENWVRSFDDPVRARALLAQLHVAEFVSVDGDLIDTRSGGRAMRDYLNSRSALQSPDKPRAIAVGEAIARHTANAPRLMTEFYRNAAAIGLRQVLSKFDGQSVAIAALDNAPFKSSLRGQGDDAVLAALRGTQDRIDLPRIVYTAHTSAFYPPLLEFCDRDRTAVGLTDSGDAWIAAEIDSKLEVDAETTEFWCDRLEMAALNSGLHTCRIWLIAPEGFDEPSLELLNERGAYGSSRKQIELLKELLAHPVSAEPEAPLAEYEITVPMGDDGEIAATRTVDDIAAKHGIAKRTATQIKTALVEALINAAEHSLSPDRRVELKFQIFHDRMRIATSNRGVRLIDRIPSTAANTEETRRGWGLKLIRGLMDDVRIEETDDGTRLVMVKYLDRGDDGKTSLSREDNV